MFSRAVSWVSSSLCLCKTTLGQLGDSRQKDHRKGSDHEQDEPQYLISRVDSYRTSRLHQMISNTKSPDEGGENDRDLSRHTRH